MRFDDSQSPPSEGTNYTFTASGDTQLSTQTVSQNPALADVQACTVTGCSATSTRTCCSCTRPASREVESLTPALRAARPAARAVTIHGENLGCPLAVAFGSNEAESFTPVEALLACGSTTAVRRGLAARGRRHEGAGDGDHARRATSPAAATRLEALFTYTGP